MWGGDRSHTTSIADRKTDRFPASFVIGRRTTIADAIDFLAIAAHAGARAELDPPVHT